LGHVIALAQEAKVFAEYLADGLYGHGEIQLGNATKLVLFISNAKNIIKKTIKNRAAQGPYTKIALCLEAWKYLSRLPWTAKKPLNVYSRKYFNSLCT